jgi:hypothetical protein
LSDYTGSPIIVVLCIFVQVDFKRERKVSESIKNSFSSLDEEKLKKRAERFGIDPDSTKVAPVTKEQMKDLYERYFKKFIYIFN